jgi:sec-independent protein translocase protein TatA
MGSSLLTPTHLVLLLVALLLLFGAKRLPEIGRSLGTGMREFKESVSGGGGEERVERSELPAPVSVPAPGVVSEGSVPSGGSAGSARGAGPVS